MNMDYSQVMRFAQHVLGDSRPKIGANLMYDFGALAAEGVHVGGPQYDIQFAEALLNSEEPSVALDALAEKYCGVGKVTSVLYDWLARWAGGRATDRQRSNLYLSPPSLAGPYAEADAALPISVLTHQWPKLIQRGVLDLFHLECKLIPLLVKMRLRGAPVDVEYAERLKADLTEELKGPEALMKNLVGKEVNPNARESMMLAFAAVGLPIPQTLDKKSGESKPSFAAPLLEKIDHPLAAAIVEWRQITKVRDTFVQSYILDKNVDGMLYCSFHPLKGDGNGARSGRFSSSDPNLQNIPVRTEVGRRVRKAFAARQGARWRKFDYSQIEYRMLAHHAVGGGAQELRDIFISDPNADYHEVTIQLIKKLTALDLERRPAKTINFGLIYGMSEKELIARLKLSAAKGRELFGAYHAAAPFARATMEAAAAEAERLGYVETLLGRKSDFHKWSQKGWDEERAALDYAAACRKWGPYNIERAFKHKALNRKLQGGAADVMKYAMVSAYEAGCFEDDACGMPSLTVHDELDFEDTGSLDNPAWEEFKHIMETCLKGKLSVPVIMDMSVGPNWGDAD